MLERLELDPSKPEAADTWRYWKMTFNIFLEAVSTYFHDRQIEIETVNQPPFSDYFQTHI